MLRESNIAYPVMLVSNVANPPGKRLKINGLRGSVLNHVVARFLRIFLSAPVPWMTRFWIMNGSSLRHEAVLIHTVDPHAPMAMSCRERDARWDVTAKRTTANDPSGSPNTTRAYTVPTTGLPPTSE